MTIREFVPPFLKDYLRLLRLKHRYPHCDIHSSLILDGVRLGSRVGIERNVELGPDVEVGAFSYINAGSIVTCARIGRYCSIGYCCHIGPYEHPTDYISSSPHMYRRSIWNECRKPAQIGSDVWIGSNAVLLQGISIGTGSIIAAGAVVTKDVAPYSIVGGVPARLLKPRFDPDTSAALLQSRWWELDESALAEMAGLFGKPLNRDSLPPHLFARPSSQM